MTLPFLERVGGVGGGNGGSIIGSSDGNGSTMSSSSPLGNASERVMVLGLRVSGVVVGNGGPRENFIKI